MPSVTDFFTSLFAAYPAGQELRIEIRPLLPEYRKEEMRADGATEDDIKTIHHTARAWYCLEPKYLRNAAAYAESLAADFDVYFGVLPRQERTGRQEDVYFASCLFADVDGGEEGVQGAVGRIKAAPIPKPHIAIESGNGCHCYWLLPEPVALPDNDSRARFKMTLRRLCKAIGGTSPAAHADSSACEVARILRVPNTLNHKRQDALRPVRIRRFALPELFLSATVLGQCAERNNYLPLWDYDQWRAALPVEPAPKWDSVPKSPPVSPAGFLPDWLLRYAQKGFPEGNRHKELASVTAWLIRDKGIAKADAIEIVWTKAQNSPGRRPIARQEIEDMVRWA